MNYNMAKGLVLIANACGTTEVEVNGTEYKVYTYGDIKKDFIHYQENTINEYGAEALTQSELEDIVEEQLKETWWLDNWQEEMLYHEWEDLSEEQKADYDNEDDYVEQRMAEQDPLEYLNEFYGMEEIFNVALREGEINIDQICDYLEEIHGFNCLAYGRYIEEVWVEEELQSYYVFKL